MQVLKNLKRKNFTSLPFGASSAIFLRGEREQTRNNADVSCQRLRATEVYINRHLYFKREIVFHAPDSRPSMGDGGVTSAASAAEVSPSAAKTWCTLVSSSTKWHNTALPPPIRRGLIAAVIAVRRVQIRGNNSFRQPSASSLIHNLKGRAIASAATAREPPRLLSGLLLLTLCVYLCCWAPNLRQCREKVLVLLPRSPSQREG